MKAIIGALVFASLTGAASLSSAQGMQAKASFAGSDTLAGVMTDAIIAAGMDQQLQYTGGGSGLGEKGLVTGDQGIAPMSREVKPEVLQQMRSQGLDAVEHVVALDGLSMFVKKDHPVASLDLQTITRIYSCELTKWEQVPQSGRKGEIKVYRRNDNSGTTDAFKHFTGLKTFGSCVTAVNETADISDVTSRDPLAIGYAGLQGKVAKNRYVAIAAKPGGTAVLPTTKTVRNFSYPMARKLFVYEVAGSRKPTDIETQFLGYVTDRSFLDPIVQAHEFITID